MIYIKLLIILGNLAEALGDLALWLIEHWPISLCLGSYHCSEGSSGRRERPFEQTGGPFLFP
ncbi:MAG: hypothetical protein ACR2QH_13130 [Geminicoccaceae bacterium]